MASHSTFSIFLTLLCLSIAVIAVPLSEKTEKIVRHGLGKITPSSRLKEREPPVSGKEGFDENKLDDRDDEYSGSHHGLNDKLISRGQGLRDTDDKDDKDPVPTLLGNGVDEDNSKESEPVITPRQTLDDEGPDDDEDDYLNNGSDEEPNDDDNDDDNSNGNEASGDNVDNDLDKDIQNRGPVRTPKPVFMGLEEHGADKDDNDEDDTDDADDTDDDGDTDDDIENTNDENVKFDDTNNNVNKDDGEDDDEMDN